VLVCYMSLAFCVDLVTGVVGWVVWIIWMLYACFGGFCVTGCVVVGVCV